ncbi:MASE1 domain-containing protein [Streptomyces sp. NPDC057062]|uniref:MASE1 domain-containing protein n=1 Tax=Streptomyces sp. NPDC057062 TaxID=3346011 RepID=UPI003633A036
MGAPVLLVLRSVRRPRSVPAARWVEGALLVTATVCVGFLQTGPVPLLFLGFPVLIWAAFRFQRAGAAPCALALSTFAIVAAAERTGPFAAHNLLTNMITLQAFNGSIAFTALLLGGGGQRAQSDPTRHPAGLQPAFRHGRQDRAGRGAPGSSRGRQQRGPRPLTRPGRHSSSPANRSRYAHRSATSRRSRRPPDFCA